MKRARLPPEVRIPQDWDVSAHRRWESGARHDAIRAVIERLNAAGAQKPGPLMTQAAYYLFLVEDYAGAAMVLENHVTAAPDDLEALLNLTVCYSRAGRYEDALRCGHALLERDPENMVALDALASTLYRLGRHDEARHAGERALGAKDRATRAAARSWRLPAGHPRGFAAAGGKRNVIAYSLWGGHPRYLRGALRNVLLAGDIYPGWVMRFYVDDSVPPEFIGLLARLGAEMRPQPAGQSLRQKLCWRFGVADDPGVGRFLVRDADSIIGLREARAVQAWLDSDRWFHVIRDWWTHTDPVLAGLWGGVAGVLPPLGPMLARYASGKAETPNVDQWFLREQVWAYLKTSCLVHDRIFRAPDAVPLPGPEPQGSYHLGQDEYAARGSDQERLLEAWIARYPCLGAPEAATRLKNEGPRP